VWDRPGGVVAAVEGGGDGATSEVEGVGVEAPLPPGFTEHWSTKHNTAFWVHVASGASTWERPQLAAADEASEESKEEFLPPPEEGGDAAEEHRGKRAIPEGWQEVWDEASGTHYYWHPESQQSSWVHPEDSAAAPTS
jgi:hypothetical protein